LETIFFEGIKFKTLEKILKCNMPWMHDEIFNLEKYGSWHGQDSY
jgi:hypothetical protein